MELPERIIAYVTNHYPTSMTALEHIVQSKGFSMSEFYAALEVVHRDKRIVQTTRRGEVYYSPYIAPPVVAPPKHLEWIKNNYPQMNSTNDGSGIDIGDLSWMFLRSKEERDAFKAAMTGRTVYNKKHEYARK